MLVLYRSSVHSTKWFFLRRFWLRAITVASEPAQRRFIRAFNEYVFGVVHEASDRISGRIRSIADYFQLRKRTVGAYSSFMCIELGLEIPDRVMEHPAIQSLLSLTADSIILTNVCISLAKYVIVANIRGQDLYSYNNEQAAGHDGHNIITVVMNEKGVDLDGAITWLEKYNDEVLTKFQTQRRMLPSWDPDMDRVVNEYVERLGYWIRGHDQWSFESRRYFGTKGPEIQEGRLVTLLPKVMKPGVSPMMAPSMVQPSVSILVN